LARRRRGARARGLERTRDVARVVEVVVGQFVIFLSHGGAVG
jgi:hypothetical protein